MRFQEITDRIARDHWCRMTSLTHPGTPANGGTAPCGATFGTAAGPNDGVTRCGGCGVVHPVRTAVDLPMIGPPCVACDRAGTGYLADGTFLCTQHLAEGTLSYAYYPDEFLACVYIDDRGRQCTRFADHPGNHWLARP